MSLGSPPDCPLLVSLVSLADGRKLQSVTALRHCPRAHAGLCGAKDTKKTIRNHSASLLAPTTSQGMDPGATRAAHA